MKTLNTRYISLTWCIVKKGTNRLLHTQISLKFKKIEKIKSEKVRIGLENFLPFSFFAWLLTLLTQDHLIFILLISQSSFSTSSFTTRTTISFNLFHPSSILLLFSVTSPSQYYTHHYIILFTWPIPLYINHLQTNFHTSSSPL